MGNISDGPPQPPITCASIQPLPQMWLSQAQRRRQKMQKKVPHMDMHTPKPGCTNFLGKCQCSLKLSGLAWWFGTGNRTTYHSVTYYITSFHGVKYGPWKLAMFNLYHPWMPLRGIVHHLGTWKRMIFRATTANAYFSAVHWWNGRVFITENNKKTKTTNRYKNDINRCSLCSLNFPPNKTCPEMSWVPRCSLPARLHNPDSPRAFGGPLISANKPRTAAIKRKVM